MKIRNATVLRRSSAYLYHTFSQLLNVDEVSDTQNKRALFQYQENYFSWEKRSWTKILKKRSVKNKILQFIFLYRVWSIKNNIFPGGIKESSIGVEPYLAPSDHEPVKKSYPLKSFGRFFLKKAHHRFLGFTNELRSIRRKVT